MSHVSPRGGDTVGLGELLRRAREGRGLTLEQISNETKIPYRHLKALEHDNVAAVSGEFYRRAEIRAYARAVRLDQNVALAEFERASRPQVARVAIAERRRVPEPAQFQKRLLIAITVVVTAAVLGRAMSEREPALKSDGHISQGIELSRVATPPVLDGPAPAAIEPAAVAAAPNSTGELAETTPQNELRGSADSVTELVVTTRPAGARVTVNGIGWGISPVTVRYLPAGHKRIRVTKEGYAAEERIVQVVEGRPSVVDIQLRSTP